MRGYAQLGVLTELCWAPAHKVFKARALLYAQRMTQKYPGPRALDHLALALAYCGLPGAALETLAQAKAGGEAAPDKAAAARAPWHAAIEAYCRIDTEALEKMSADRTLGQLSAWLNFMALEQGGCNPLAQEYGQNLMRTAMPECFRVYAGLNRIAGVGLGHLVTAAGPVVLAQGLPEHLHDLPGLPTRVTQSLDKWPKAIANPAQFGGVWKLEADTITALLDCGRAPVAAANAAAPAADAQPAGGQPAEDWSDDNELRWETLGLILREVSWEQAWRRTFFLRTILGVSPDDWLQETRPLADIHPYGDFLQLWHWERAEGEKFAPAACRRKPLGIELPGVWLGFELQAFNQAKGEEFMVDAFRNCDETAFELTQKMTWTNHDDSLDGRAGTACRVASLADRPGAAPGARIR